jgi:hypothetical protein
MHPRKEERVAPIGFDAISGLSRRSRWGDDLRWIASVT